MKKKVVWMVFIALGGFLFFAGDGMSFFWGNDDDKKKTEELKQEIKKEVMKDVYIEIFKKYVEELHNLKKKEEARDLQKSEGKSEEKRRNDRSGKEGNFSQREEVKVFEKKVAEENVKESEEVMLGDALKKCSYDVVEKIINPDNLKSLKSIFDMKVKESNCERVKDFFVKQASEEFVVEVKEKALYVKDIYMKEYYVGRENFEKFKKDVMGLLVDGKAEVRFRDDGYVEVVDSKKGHEKVVAYLEQVLGKFANLEKFHFDVVVKKGNKGYHYNGSFLAGEVANLGLEGNLELVKVVSYGGKKVGWQFRLFHVMGVNRVLTFLESDLGKRYMFVDGDLSVEIMIDKEDMVGK